MASLIPWDAICLILVRRGRDAVGGAEGGRGGGGAKHREREGDGRHITGLNGMDRGSGFIKVCGNGVGFGIDRSGVTARKYPIRRA